MTIEKVPKCACGHEKGDHYIRVGICMNCTTCDCFAPAPASLTREDAARCSCPHGFPCEITALRAEVEALKARLTRIDAFSGERCEGCNGTVEYHDNDGIPLCAECWEELRHAE